MVYIYIPGIFSYERQLFTRQTVDCVTIAWRWYVRKRRTCTWLGRRQLAGQTSSMPSITQRRVATICSEEGHVFRPVLSLLLQPQIKLHVMHVAKFAVLEIASCNQWRSNLLKFRRKKGDFVDRLRDIICVILFKFGKRDDLHCYYRYLSYGCPDPPNFPSISSPICRFWSV